MPYNNDYIRLAYYQNEPEDTIDVLFIGSSCTFADYSAPYAYEKYGYTSYSYAVSGMTCTCWKPALIDALRTQSPKLVVVDAFGAGYIPSIVQKRNSQAYVTLNNMPLSLQRTVCARELGTEITTENTAGFLFPVIKFHKDIPNNLLDFGTRIAPYKGRSFLKGIEGTAKSRDYAPVDPATFTDDSEPVDEGTEAIVRDFIRYCKSKGIEVLFVKYPAPLTEENTDDLGVNLRANEIGRIAVEEGASFLNMQSIFPELGVNEGDDFYNYGHANTRGQKKITDYLGRYLVEEMGVSRSELDEQTRADWDECVRYYGAYSDLSEELIRSGVAIRLSDSPELNRQLERVLGGESSADVAKDMLGGRVPQAEDEENDE